MRPSPARMPWIAPGHCGHRAVYSREVGRTAGLAKETRWRAVSSDDEHAQEHGRGRAAGSGESGTDALAFRGIEPEEYKEFLQYLLQTDHIQRTEEGSLIIGLGGEKIVNNYRFYAVFKDDEEHVVYNGSEEIGSITTVPPPGYCFSLAGKVWKVEEVDTKHKALYVKSAKGKVDTLWLGAGGDVHTRVVQKMREVLADSAIYPYLAPGAVNRLERARRLARKADC